MKERKIIVCIKAVPDPEGPPSAFEIDQEARRVKPVGIPPVINPFDANALEAALQIKDSLGGRVVVLSVAEKLSLPILRNALSVGAEELILLQDEHFKDLDSYSTAYVLAMAITKISGYDLVLAGRQSSDWGFGQTGSLIAEMLQIPSITAAQQVRIVDDAIIAEKLKRNGYEVTKTSIPALVTASSEIGDLRLFTLMGLKDARSKPVTVWNVNDLGIDPQQLKARNIAKLTPPPSRKRTCVFIQGESEPEKGAMLARKLREDRVI